MQTIQDEIPGKLLNSICSKILYKFCAWIPQIYFEQILVCNKDTIATKPDIDKS